MAGYEIRFKASAEKEFRKLPRNVQRRFVAAFGLLQEDPRRPRSGCDIQRLSSHANTWRLRVGDYRGIYAIVDSVIRFTRFGHRGSVYRI